MRYKARVRLALAVLLCSCTCGGSALEVEGERGFVRCFAAEPIARDHLQGRLLSIDIDTDPWTLVVLRGEGQTLGSLDAARRAMPELVVLLGGIGDDTQVAGQNVAALEALGAPVLFVASGRDERAVILRALEGRRVIDATPLRLIRAGGLELVPVGGAPGGRYARTVGACGVDDAEPYALDPSQGQRLLLSWAAPPPAPGLLGVEAGSPLVAEIAERAHATEGVFAWPEGVTTAEPLRVFAGADPVVLEVRGGRAAVPGAP